MEKQIQEQLEFIEKHYDVTILFACETGSRAWGFPSPDSDYDVRFIYMHKLDWYLSINDKKDTIEYMLGDLDLVGWDIRKSLRLFRKSNAAMFERIQSPIIYKTQTDFIDQLNELAPDYFSCRAGLHHYLSMAFKYYNDCKAKEEVKLKSYFYMLRTALASLWIVEKGTVPPLEFRFLLELVADQELKDKILELVALKSTKPESYLHFKEPGVETFTQQVLTYCETKADQMEKQCGEIAPLDDLFMKTIAVCQSR